MPSISELYPVPAEIRKLHAFLGDWDVTGTVTIQGDARKIKGRWLFSIAAGGWGLKSSNRLIVEELGDYELDNLFGYDKETGILHIYSITNMAETHDHRAVWSDVNVLKGAYDGLKDGKIFRENFVIKFISSEECTINYIEKVGGKIDSTMELRLEKCDTGTRGRG
jgi:hypothetical protein